MYRYSLPISITLHLLVVIIGRLAPSFTKPLDDAIYSTVTIHYDREQKVKSNNISSNPSITNESQTKYSPTKQIYSPPPSRTQKTVGTNSTVQGNNKTPQIKTPAKPQPQSKPQPKKSLTPPIKPPTPPKKAQEITPRNRLKVSPSTSNIIKDPDFSVKWPTRTSRPFDSNITEQARPVANKQNTGVVKKNGPIDLKLGIADTLRVTGSDSEDKSESAKDPNKVSSSSIAFSRPPGSRAIGVFSSSRSDLVDGEVSLLNQKATQYSVFVSRVSESVFARLRTLGWERLSHYQLRALTGMTKIEALMSLDGKLLNYTVLESSGLKAFDDLVIDSLKNSLRDPNPPQSAAVEDPRYGKVIKFVFVSRSWSRLTPTPRSRSGEIRWLYLGTGLL